jgi:Skp family chaperone for outer membrane proteins
MAFLNVRVLAQEGNNVKQATNSAVTQSAPATLKIGVINIAEVLKKFAKAEVVGNKIVTDAQKYESSLKEKTEALKKREGDLATLPENQREQERRAIRDAYGRLQDEDQAAKKDILTRRDAMAKEINTNIQTVIDSLARYHGFEMVLTCPDATTKEERESLANAMRHMTVQGAFIAWRDPRLDVTDECVRWLNHYFPAPAGSAPATSNTPAATGNGQPPR